ncbi:MAG: rhamnulokinase family protein [Planctomycetaceae bacterium]
MPSHIFLAIDLGAESGRVIAGVFDGKTMRLDELHRFPNGAVGFAETLRWNVLRLWSDIKIGLAKAADKYGSAIVSIGVDTWGVDYVLLSAGDEMLGQPYHYRDRRTQGMLAQAMTKVSRAEIFANTGLQFMEINTLYQLLAANLAPHSLLPLARTFLLMPDFFHWLLCGSRVVEFTNATTTQCLHPTERDWAWDMLKKFGIPTEMFPSIVTPGTNLGRLRESVAAETGLSRIPVVTPATHDTASAVAAVPTTRTGSASWAYISSGTWSLMGVEVESAILTPQALARNVTNEGGIDGTYRLLKNIMGLWLVQECKRSFEKQGTPVSYAELMTQAAAAEPFRSLVDPDDISFLAPADMPTAIREWCKKSNQPIPESAGALVRCALESLALKYRKVLGWLEELTGEKTEVIHIVGGGTQNELLNQFTADACGLQVVTGPIEATALGNVLVQARSAGVVGSLGEIREIVRNSSTMKEYEPKNASAWNAAYYKFEELGTRC